MEKVKNLPVGVVLAGGTSGRLGRDKTALLLGGISLLDRAAALMRDVVGRVFIVGRQSRDFPWIPDETPGLGPAGGIASALRHTGESCLVVSCDLPLLDADSLRRLLAAWEERKDGETLATLCRNRESGAWEPLVGVYEPGFLPLLDAGLARGEKKIDRHLPRARVRFLDYGEKEALPFFNLNRPSDLALLQKFFELSGSGALV
ncbi:MAG: molybdenum cofactor guanylyltransferase [Desulfovibrio sp.]|jgi:molybdopterin-guanine dinucleotide biosynthesis protein A|nr:molybdenum cofactor guanylyltransferase [Desulfovibrio sp.]